MKKSLLYLSSLALLISLGSCNLDTDDSNNYQTIPYSTCNLVIPQDGEAFATPANYVMAYYYNSRTVTVSSTNLNLTGSGASPFTTNAMPFSASAFQTEWVNYTEVTTFSGNPGSSSGVNITNLSGYTSRLMTADPGVLPNIPAYPFTINMNLVMRYTADGTYNVYTFAPDAIFYGKTTVNTLGAAMEPYTSDETLYRVMFDKEMKKADILFLNAKFNERMPSKRINFLVKDLDVVYSKSGYSIQMPAETEYIIPEYYEGSSFTPYPSYRFTSFNLSSSVSNNLTEATANFNLEYYMGENLAARYNCTFSGSYVTDGSSEE